MLSQGNNEFSEVDREGLAASWPENTSRDGVRDATEDAEDASVKTEREEEQAEAAEGSIAVSAADELLPPLHRLLVGGAGSAEKLEEDQAPGDSATTATAFVHEIITVVARLDRANPLTEAKWVRAGNPDEWIESIAGPAGALAAASAGLRPQAGKTPKGASYPAMPLNGRDASSESAETSAWKGRIKVADPEAVRLLSFPKPLPPSSFGNQVSSEGFAAYTVPLCFFLVLFPLAADSSSPPPAVNLPPPPRLCSVSGAALALIFGHCLSPLHLPPFLPFLSRPLPLHDVHPL